MVMHIFCSIPWMMDLSDFLRSWVIYPGGLAQVVKGWGWFVGGSSPNGNKN